MIIPNAENAFIDIRKLRDYTLDPKHRIGRHKARLFVSLIGMTQADVGALRDVLLDVICTHEATLGEKNDHGQRYELDFIMRWQGQQAWVHSVWNVRPHEKYPRLVTCYPLKGRKT